MLHLVDLARRATSDNDTDLALQLLVGAARRVWWRDPGEHVRRAIVDAAGETSVPPHDPRLLAVLGLSESLELSAVVLEHLARWPADAAGRSDLAGLLGIAAFCIGDFGRATAFLSAPIQELRAQGRLSLLPPVPRQLRGRPEEVPAPHPQGAGLPRLRRRRTEAL